MRETNIIIDMSDLKQKKKQGKMVMLMYIP